MTPEIKIMSRAEAVKYTQGKHDTESIIISIMSPNMAYPDIMFMTVDNKVRNILTLYFTNETTGNRAMTESDARILVNFIYRYAGTPRIIIQSDNAINRAPGVAAAIAMHELRNDNYILENPAYSPNGHCYRLVTEAFNQASDPHRK